MLSFTDNAVCIFTLPLSTEVENPHLSPPKPPDKSNDAYVVFAASEAPVMIFECNIPIIFELPCYDGFGICYI